MTTTNDPAVAPSTPGAMLAKARRDLGLSQEEVAGRLHLAPRQVAAIEADDYSQLPGATYVRGYLRSYAELAGLAPAPLIEAFNRQTAAAPAVRYDTIATTKEVTSQHHQMQLVTYVIAAVVIGLLAAWWFGRDASKPVVTTQLPAGVTVEQAPLQPAIDPQAAATPAAAPAAAPAAVAAPAAPVLAPAAPKPVPAAVAPVPAQAANAGVTVAPAPVVVPAPPPPAAAAPVLRARIVLRANEESWADVRDAQQNRLIYETVPAGRTVTLEGVAPLQVYIGNAGGVTIEANGQALDLTRYRRGTVARFTVEAPTVGSR